MSLEDSSLKGSAINDERLGHESGHRLVDIHLAGVTYEEEETSSQFITSIYMVRSCELYVFYSDTTQVISLANIIIALKFPVRLPDYLDLDSCPFYFSKSPGMSSHSVTSLWLLHCRSSLEHINYTSFMELQIVSYDPRHPCMPCRPPYP